MITREGKLSPNNISDADKLLFLYTTLDNILLLCVSVVFASSSEDPAQKAVEIYNIVYNIKYYITIYDFKIVH